MLERIIYKNHRNETVEWGSGGIYADHNELRDFSWSIISRNNRFSSFYRGPAKKKLPCMIACKNPEDGIAARNRLFEVLEKDVLAGKHGRLIIGDYYLRCYVTESQKTEYLHSKGYMLLSLTVQTDYPEWIKETTKVFSAKSESTDAYLDYPFDYSFDYKNSLSNSVITNGGIVDANFRLVIYGAVSNPALYIAGHEYSVGVDIAEGEYLTIDSVAKTVVLTRNNGEEINCFNLRNRESYIFKKIPTGESTITSPNNQIYFDITLLDERSEPKWT